MRAQLLSSVGETSWALILVTSSSTSTRWFFRTCDVCALMLRSLSSRYGAMSTYTCGVNPTEVGDS